MKILICGDRNYKNRGRIRMTLLSLKKIYDKIEYMLEGGAKGADTLGNEVARELGFEVKTFPANWEKYGRAAGPIRNKEMLDQLEIGDIILAFHDNFKDSKGTKNMVEIGTKKGIKTYLIGKDYLDIL